MVFRTYAQINIIGIHLRSSIEMSWRRMPGITYEVWNEEAIEDFS